MAMGQIRTTPEFHIGNTDSILVYFRLVIMSKVLANVKMEKKRT